MFNIFKKPEEVDEKDKLQERIVDIRTRIAAIRRCNGWDQKSTEVTSPQSQPLVARETKPEQTSQRQTEKIRQKDTQAELNDIRAKLRAKQK
jgi:hypothetical protein